MCHGRSLDRSTAVADPRRHGGLPRHAQAEPDGRAFPDLPGERRGRPYDFSPLEVETYFIEPDATDIQVFYTIPAEGWISW